MRSLYFVAMVLATTGTAASSAQAQPQQVSPTRIEFTRPGGTPGAARAVVRGSDVYMLAPAQPQTAIKAKRRNKR